MGQSGLFSQVCFLRWWNSPSICLQGHRDKASNPEAGPISSRHLNGWQYVLQWTKWTTAVKFFGKVTVNPFCFFHPVMAGTCSGLEPEPPLRHRLGKESANRWAKSQYQGPWQGPPFEGFYDSFSNKHYRLLWFYTFYFFLQSTFTTSTLIALTGSNCEKTVRISLKSPQL